MLALVLVVSPARADVTTERGASVLVFPKVFFDSASTVALQSRGPVDTIIQISNTSNSIAFARCLYVNAAPVDPTRPASITNPPQWQETDFEIFLTRQQPTHWLVSTGRLTDASDNRPCASGCNGAGFDPGLIPPVADPFEGELKCIEVDSSGAPISGNHLKGEVTIVSQLTGDVSKYNAIGILGLNDSNNSDDTLCLGGGSSQACPTGAEYNACPESLVFSHFSENATDPVAQELGNGPLHVITELTLVPCTEDFENQVATQLNVQFAITNEFEEQFSTSIPVTCWANLPLNSIFPIFDVSVLGTRFAQTRITSPDTDVTGNVQSGVLGVAEEFHQSGTERNGLCTGAPCSRAAFNLHTEGERPNGDVIVLPGVLF